MVAALVAAVMLVVLIVFGPVTAQHGGPVLRLLPAEIVWGALMATTLVAVTARRRAGKLVARLVLAAVAFCLVFNASLIAVWLGPGEESTHWEWEYITDDGSRVVRTESSLSKKGPAFHEIHGPLFRSGTAIPGIGDLAPCSWTVVKPTELAGAPEHCPAR